MAPELRQCADGGQTQIGGRADDGQTQFWVSEGVQEVEYGKRATLWQGSDSECEKPGHTDLESVPVAP